jgi:hypothetical protein
MASLKQALILSGILSLTLGVAGGLAYMRPSSVRPVAEAAKSESGRARELAREVMVILHRVDLTPETMAAAGLNATQAISVARAMGLYYASADRSVQIRLTTEAANAPIPTDGTDAERAAAAEAARDAAIQLKQLLDQAFEISTVVLDSGLKSKLANMRANKTWGLPLPYLVVAPDARTPADWAKLRGALAHVSATAKEGLPAKPAAVAIVSSADGAADVIAAKADLANNLAAIKQAWDAEFLTQAGTAAQP